MRQITSEIALIASLALLSISCDSGSSNPTPAKSEPNYTVPDQITLTAWASRDANNGTVINGTTNLPNGTKLGVELMNGRRTRAQDFKVFVELGKFHSAGFRYGTSPILSGKQKVHIFTHFTSLWQSPAVLKVLGDGGSKLKLSAVIHSEDAQLIDGDKVLNYTADLIVPPFVSAPAERDTSRPSASPISTEATAIQIVKKAVLTVDGSRSSMNVEDGASFYFRAPGIRMGDGWSATPTANDNTFNVVLDFINSDGKGKEWHDKAMWEVNLVTKKVLYRNKSAKGFSWIPAE